MSNLHGVFTVNSKKGVLFMCEKKGVVATQIRLPAGIHEYIKQEADRMGIAQNAFLVILLEMGKKLWESDVSRFPEK